jgi:hypothetical protein
MFKHPFPLNAITQSTLILAFLLGILSLSVLYGMPVQATELSWPKLALPKTIQRFERTEPFWLNGFQTQTQVFISTLSVDEVKHLFKTQLNAPLIENHRGTLTILGQALNPRDYLTVTLEALPKRESSTGSKGIISVTRLEEKPSHSPSNEWLAALPSPSRLLSDIQSDDANEQSHDLIIVNTHSLKTNREQLIQAMQQKGLSLEASPHASSLDDHPIAKDQTLFFKGVQQEAMATLHRRSTGESQIVLHHLYHLETVK